MAKPHNPRGQYRIDPANADTKRCPRCERTLAVDAFNRNRAAPDGRQSYCRDCVQEHYDQPSASAAQRKRLADPVKKAAHADRVRDGHLRRRYGLTPDDYDALLDGQDGKCALCADVNRDGRRLAVDHCHETGTVRGLLCNACNVLLHKVETRAVSIERIAEYLKEPSEC